MADTVVYTENFAAGNSTFSNQNVYDTPTSPNPGVDPYDPLYPEIVAAEGAKIIGGKLDWNGTWGHYQTCAIVVKTATPWNGTRGYMKWTVTPNAASLADTSSMPVSFMGINSNYGIKVAVESLGTNIEIRPLSGWDASPEGNVPFAFVAGVEYRFHLRWQCGTVIGDFDDVLADGWFRLYLNETLIYEQLNFALYVDYLSNNFVDKAWVGYYGWLGAFSYLEFGTFDVVPPISLPEVSLVSSTPIVCCKPSTVNKDKTAGPISSVVDPTWYPSCPGGGTVPSSPDLVDPESWIS